MKKTILTLLASTLLIFGCKKEVSIPTSTPTPTSNINDFTIKIEVFDNGMPSYIVGNLIITDSTSMYNNGVSYNYQIIPNGYLYEEITLNDISDAIRIYTAYHLNTMFFAGSWIIDTNDQIIIKVYKNNILIYSESGFDVGGGNIILLN